MPSSGPLRPPERLQARFTTWSQGEIIVRVHSVQFGPTQFNPGKGHGGRFDPLHDRSGQPVPTLYGASDFTAALAETVFREASDTGAVITHPRIAAAVRSTLRPLRALRLVNLYATGLKALGVRRRDLIDSPAAVYHRTRAWSQALYDATRDGSVDGLLYRPRHAPAHDAVLLWGDRVSADDIGVIEDSAPLVRSDLYARVLALANDLGFVVTPAED